MKNGFDVSPSEVVFQNVQPGSIYRETFCILNKSQRPRVLKIQPPENPQFEVVDLFKPISIAPGMKHNVTVLFHCRDEREINSNLHLHSEGTNSADSSNVFDVEISLKAFPKMANIRWDPVADFGNVSMGSTPSQYIRLWNAGTRQGDFSFDLSSLEGLVRITPSSGTLLPVAEDYEDFDALESKSEERIETPISTVKEKQYGQKIKMLPHAILKVRIEFQARTAGPINVMVPIRCTNGLTSPLDSPSVERWNGNHGFLHITGSTLQQRVRLVYPSNQLETISEIDFGSLFYGEKKTVNALLTNQGPQSCSFTISQHSKELSLIVYSSLTPLALDRSSASTPTRKNSKSPRNPQSPAKSPKGELSASSKTKTGRSLRSSTQSPPRGRKKAGEEATEGDDSSPYPPMSLTQTTRPLRNSSSLPPPRQRIVLTEADTSCESYSDLISNRNSAKHITFNPLIGSIQSCSSVPVTLTFNPPPLSITKDVVPGHRVEGETVNVVASLEVAETGQKAQISLKGRVLNPQVVIDKQVIDFGECFLNDRADAIIKIRNDTDRLSVPFSFQKVPFFSATPNQGHITSGQLVEIRITFKPAQLGDFSQKLPLSLCGGTKMMGIQCYGKTVTPLPAASILKAEAALMDEIGVDPRAGSSTMKSAVSSGPSVPLTPLSMLMTGRTEQSFAHTSKSTGKDDQMMALTSSSSISLTNPIGRQLMAKASIVQTGGVTAATPSDFQRRRAFPAGTLRTHNDFAEQPKFIGSSQNQSPSPNAEQDPNRQSTASRHVTLPRDFDVQKRKQMHTFLKDDIKRLTQTPTLPLLGNISNSVRSSTAFGLGASQSADRTTRRMGQTISDLDYEINKQRYTDFLRTSQQQRLIGVKITSSTTGAGTERGATRRRTPLQGVVMERGLPTIVRGIGRQTPADADSEHMERDIVPTYYDPFGDKELGLATLSTAHNDDIEEPRLPPLKEEPLFTLSQSKSEAVAKPKLRPQLTDTMKLVKHKYKSTPSTAVEAKEVKMPLTPQDITLLSIGTRLIDFGKVCVYSRSSRSLNIANDLGFNISATLSILNAELQQSTPTTQIIPPNAMAGFDIVFVSAFPQSFTAQILVQINGVNVFNVAVKAEAIPISLELSSSELLLTFPSSNLKATAVDTITVTNPGNHPADFEFERDLTASCVIEGVYIDSGRRKDGQPVDYHKLKPYIPMENPSGLDSTIEWSGTAMMGRAISAASGKTYSSRDTNAASVVASQPPSMPSSIPSTPVRVRKPETREKHSKNKDKSGYHSDELTLRTDCFFITPQKGTVPPFSSITVTVTFDPTSLPQPPPNYSTLCTMHVDGGGDRSFRVFGEVPEGKAEFVEKQLDFGAFAVGAEVTRHATLKNTGKIDAVFFTEETDQILTVSPRSGVVPVGGTALLSLSLRAATNRKIHELLQVSIRGGSQISLPISGEALEPNVEIIENSIEFGDVVLGNKERKRLTITNTGSIAAILYCDLSSHPEFTIQQKERANGAVSSLSAHARSSSPSAVPYSGDKSLRTSRPLSNMSGFKSALKEHRENVLTSIAPSSIPLDLMKAIMLRMGNDSGKTQREIELGWHSATVTAEELERERQRAIYRKKREKEKRKMRKRKGGVVRESIAKIKESAIEEEQDSDDDDDDDESDDKEKDELNSSEEKDDDEDDESMDADDSRSLDKQFEKDEREELKSNENGDYKAVPSLSNTISSRASYVLGETSTSLSSTLNSNQQQQQQSATLSLFHTPSSPADVWGKWNGVGAFDYFHLPLQGCVDYLGIFPQSIGLSAFAQPQLATDAVGHSVRSITGDFPVSSRQNTERNIREKLTERLQMEELGRTANMGTSEKDSALTKRTERSQSSINNRKTARRKTDRKLGGSSSASSENNKYSTHQNSSQPDAEELTAYRVEIQPSSLLQLDLIFTASKLESYDFPLFFMLSANQSEASSLSLTKPVTARTVPASLIVTPHSIDFGPRVMSSLSKPLHKQSVILHNSDSQPLHWSVHLEDIEDIAAGTFQISPVEGILLSGGDAECIISFFPSEARTFNITIPFFLNDDIKPYCSVQVTALGISPMLLFEPKEVILPPVPLGFTSKARVSIRNVGYENVELHCQLPSDTAMLPLRVTFPEGVVLSLNKQTTVAEIFFTSKKSTSFSTTITFFDAFANPFPLVVHAIADNDLLTTAGFYLSTYRLNRIVQDKLDMPPYLKEDPSGIDGESLMSGAVSSGLAAAGVGQIGALSSTTATSIKAASSNRSRNERDAGNAASSANPSQQTDTDRVLTALSTSRGDDGLSESARLKASAATNSSSSSMESAPSSSRQLPNGSFISCSGGQFGLPHFPSSLSNTLVSFMNSCLISTQLVSWPQSAIELSGMPIVEAVEALVGHPIPGRATTETIQTASTQFNPDWLFPALSDEASVCMSPVARGSGLNASISAPLSSSVSPKSSHSREIGDTLLNATMGSTRHFSEKNRTTTATSIGIGGGSMLMAGASPTTAALALIQQQMQRVIPHSDRIKILLQHYDAILTFLKEQGALIAPLKPEHFLSHADFIRFSTDNYVTSVFLYPVPDYNHVLYTLQRDADIFEAFDIVSTCAWTFLAFQIFKLFLFSKITPKRFKSTPGIVQNSESDSSNGIGFGAIQRDGKKEGEKTTLQVQLLPQTKAPKPKAKKPEIPQFQTQNMKLARPTAQLMTLSLRSAETLISQKSLTQVTSSNFYSSPQILLLKWLSFHYIRSNPKRLHLVMNFSADLSDGVVLLCVIRAHAPFLRIRIIERPQSTAERMRNATTVINSVRQLGIECFLTEEDIVHPDPRSMLLFVYMLYTMLPSCIPSSTLEIPACAGITTSTTIEINNPGKHTLTYNLRLEVERDNEANKPFMKQNELEKEQPQGSSSSSTAPENSSSSSSTSTGIVLLPSAAKPLASQSDFFLPASVITIDPGKSLPLTVSVRPRFSKPAHANLYLLPKNQSGMQTPPIAFHLKTTVLPPQPIARYTVSSSLYSTAFCEVKVTNPYPSDCSLTAKLLTQKELDALAPPSSSSASSPTSTSRDHSSTSARANRSPSSLKLGSLRSGSSFGNSSRMTGAKQAHQDASFSSSSASSSSSSISNSIPHSLNVAEKVDYLPFRLNTATLSLPLGGSANLQVRFTPIKLGSQVCRIFFRDDALGEFTIEVVGTATMPGSIDTFTVASLPDTPTTHDCIMSAKNRALESLRADSSLLEKALLPFYPMPGDALVYKVELSSPFFSAPKEFSIVLDSPLDVRRSIENRRLSEASSPLSPMTSSRNNSNITTLMSTQSQSQNQGIVKFPLTFHPKQPGEYTCRLLLRSALDLRIFDIKGIVQTPGVSGSVDMNAVARHPVTQDIPIINNTTQEWIIRANINPTNGQCGSGPDCVFKGPQTVRIPGHSTGSYPLQFAPRKACDASAELVLINTSVQGTPQAVPGSEKTTYTLHGLGEDPLPEGDIKIDCIARQEVKKVISVPAITSGMPSRYNVICDVASCSGESRLTVYPRDTSAFGSTVGKEDGLFGEDAPEARSNVPSPTSLKKSFPFGQTGSPLSLPTGANGGITGSGVADYEITVFSTQSGKEEGTIMFMTEDGQCVWYNLSVTCTQPNVEETIDIATTVRVPVAVNINLFNPSLTEIVTFNVRIDGTALSGPSAFTLEPQETASYQMVYAPVLPTGRNIRKGNGTDLDSERPEVLNQNDRYASGGEDDGGDRNEEERKNNDNYYGEDGHICFSSPSTGDFLYNLHLTCDDVEPTELEEMVCELGMNALQLVEVENPLPTPIHLQCSSSNAAVFTIAPLSIPFSVFCQQVQAQQQQNSTQRIKSSPLSISSSSPPPSQLSVGKNPILIARDDEGGRMNLGVKTVNVEPYGKGQALVRYHPSIIGVPESATLTLSAKEIGQFVFKAKGKGKRPTILPDIEIVAQMQESSSKIISFANPFAHPILCDIILEPDPIRTDLLQPLAQGVSLSPSSSSSSIAISDAPSTLTPSASMPVTPSGTISSSPSRSALQALANSDSSSLLSPSGISSPATRSLNGKETSRSGQSLQGQSGSGNQSQVYQQNNMFSILLRSLSRIHVEGRGVLQAPLLFSPTRLVTSRCCVVIRAFGDPSHPQGAQCAFTEQRPLIWTQPVNGISEIFFPQVPQGPQAPSVDAMDGMKPELVSLQLNRAMSFPAPQQIASFGTKEYQTLSVVTQAGTMVSKVFHLPLNSLVVTKSMIFSFVNNCVARGLATFPSYFLKLQELTGTLALKAAGADRDMSDYVQSSNATPSAAGASSASAAQSKEKGKTDSSRAGQSFSQGIAGERVRTTSDGDELPSSEEWSAFFEVLCSLITVEVQSADEAVTSSVSVPEHPLPPAEMTSLGLTPAVSLPFTFQPLLPCQRTRVNIILKRSPRIGGGRWRYSVWVTSTNAPDEVMEGPLLTALVGHQTQSTLTITSEKHAGMPFHAIFRSGASAEFMLQPRDGFFDEKGRAKISVLFLPTRYAGMRKCVVSVSTSTKQWLYSVQGELPPYTPPTGESKVQSIRSPNEMTLLKTSRAKHQ
ncbi:putative flagellar associated protein [Monocercomonoides exilis]|uniref:putative flagellar associated protein n=1 Tax=Monocercomonoides exilis TaxID=2049356 RepID=UPI003559E1E9|nr:putative flagellar associated protein [Monocercomonoides exilis]|eukprot:MONOS_9536.1-p1 / transcript=MONOS_9536.1 / gene=MONOS_9536 / organism=Monocercomonoides_exilis_PA203 / gene_product=flagellar associated protein / transcript_product=flagellar associated protein / location=Mono_scaffold00397:38149-51862(+) / protein_length=4530 / sequence_SO=supercontig / SO=protein_coding / is_pseudo=false